MAGRNYLTVVLELVDHAEGLADYFEARGYKVLVEQRELGYPFPPTLVCKRDATTIIIEIDSAADMRRLEVWSHYCRSCQTDTRVRCSQL